MKWRSKVYNEAILTLIRDAGITQAEARRIINDEIGATFPKVNWERLFLSPEAKTRKDAPAWAPYVLEMGLRRRGLIRMSRSRQ